MTNAIIRHKPWTESRKPKKFLAMRFQALGDLMITLPYLQSLREQIPGLQIDLLTRTNVSEVPKNLKLFEKVYSISGRNGKVQFLFSMLLIPYLLYQRYDIVIDLQNHRISKIIRKLLLPKAWSEFDRSSLILAGERTRLTINSLLISNSSISTNIELKNNLDVESKLRLNGWRNDNALIILNPAGAFTSRHWPIENYISFAKLWLVRNPSSQFVMLGVNSLKQKASRIKDQLGNQFIDLIEHTSMIEAFVIVKKASLMISEDSGLMHMSWVQGKPTIALFGSSPSYWASPLGEWSKCFNSADLPCGDCLHQECKFGDVHCLTRYSPEMIVEEGEALLKSLAIK
ncbi:MAG TPA: glycosyltransferase family 9 protein [Cyclobacteriaceae bacterium]|jgi:ADP-heptose:LPS heptosyltransferase|nr:glycosyltransferase family 9 protein [Cyclobacteriaceae bacterium]